MQKCETTKGVLYKEPSKHHSISHTLQILMFTDETQVHSDAPTYSTTYGQTNSHALEPSTGREYP